MSHAREFEPGKGNRPKGNSECQQKQETNKSESAQDEQDQNPMATKFSCSSM